MGKSPIDECIKIHSDVDCFLVVLKNPLVLRGIFYCYLYSVHESLIDTIQYYISLSEADQQLVRTLFREQSLNKGAYFLKEGQVCRYLGFIHTGLIRYSNNKDGEEVISEFGKEGNFVCNYESFLDQSPSGRNIQAIEPTLLLAISFSDLQEFYRKVPGGERFGRLAIEKIYVDTIKLVTSLYTDTPEERYLKFLEYYPDLQQRIPQYYISSYVGVKPQSLSRIRKRMADK